jgi:hypothetical protein
MVRAAEIAPVRMVQASLLSQRRGLFLRALLFEAKDLEGRRLQLIDF